MTASDIRDYLQQQAPTFLPGIGASDHVTVDVTDSVRRPNAWVWFAELGTGEDVVKVVVKCGMLGSVGPFAHLPRLTPTPALPAMMGRQREALEAIEKALMSAEDPRFRAVRPLAHCTATRMLVMTHAPGDEVAHHLLRIRGASSPRNHQALLRYTKDAGGWLRMFHDGVHMEPGAHVFEALHAVCDQAAVWQEEIGLGPRGTSVHGQMVEVAAALEEPRSALLHGDFWPGNIIVDKGQLAVIDPIAWAHGPVWLDLAYFLLLLRTMDQQVRSQGVGWPGDILASAEEAFLDGYFGNEPHDRRTMWMFKVFALLAKWARSAKVLDEARGVRKLGKRVSFAWKGRYYRSLLRQFEADLA